MSADQGTIAASSPQVAYIAFLRAVNVGGRVAKMERVRATFERLRFANVRTYIQSGNVFFTSAETERAVLATTIERELERELGFDVTAIVRTVAEVEEALAAAPFANVEHASDIRFYVIFLSRALPSDLRLPLSSRKGDFEIVHAAHLDAFATARVVDGRPGNPGAYLERAYGVRATSRFYDTTVKIVAAAKSVDPR